MSKSLRVMKFGGSSVGDVVCIARVTEIIQSASSRGPLIVVASAMRGITNRLVEAAARCEIGDSAGAKIILEELYLKHDLVVRSLVASATAKEYVAKRMRQLVDDAQRICDAAAGARKLNPADHDSIVALGERLCVEILSVTLAEHGLRSRLTDGSEIVVTDDNHGAAQALIDPTRHRCEKILRPLLKDGVIPVVTGFIGATPAGVATTLGRGGSDYSAGILGVALQADEVIVWKDVDGMLTADPRKVKATRTIPEMSYREAAELAGFGAQVLHAKALEVLEPTGIALTVRNSFSPQHPGSKITVQSGCEREYPKAVIATSNVALITISKPGGSTAAEMQRQIARGLDALPVGSIRSCTVLSGNSTALLVSLPMAHLAEDAVRTASTPLQGFPQAIKLDQNVAAVVVIGEKISVSGEAAERGTRALERASLRLIAVLKGRSECCICFVVPRTQMDHAESVLHREFQLDLATPPSAGYETFRSAPRSDRLTTNPEVPDWAMRASDGNTFPV